MTPLQTALAILDNTPAEQLVDYIRPLAEDYIRVFKLLGTANQILQFTQPELERLRKLVNERVERIKDD